MSECGDTTIVRALASKAHQMREAIVAILWAADRKDQPTTSVNIPRELIERLREVSR